MCCSGIQTPTANLDLRLMDFTANGLYSKVLDKELLHETHEKKNNPLQLQKFDYHFPQSIPDCLHIIVNI